MSLKRKLQALQFAAVDAFCPSDESHFRNMVVWLEDQKIRQYGIDDRKGLRDVKSDLWPEALKAYLDTLQCPLDSITTSSMGILGWLVDYAVRLEYTDNSSKYSSASVSDLKAARQSAKPGSDNPLENLDFSSEEFKSGVNSLASALGIMQHPNPLITLKAVSALVHERLSVSKVNELQKQGSDGSCDTGDLPKLDSFPLGIDANDPVLANAGRILRLLYVRQMRDLQTEINETIVKCQALTANPKTDQRLGQVGR